MWLSSVHATRLPGVQDGLGAKASRGLCGRVGNTWPGRRNKREIGIALLVRVMDGGIGWGQVGGPVDCFSVLVQREAEGSEVECCAGERYGSDRGSRVEMEVTSQESHASSSLLMSQSSTSVFSSSLKPRAIPMSFPRSPQTSLPMGHADGGTARHAPVLVLLVRTVSLHCLVCTWHFRLRLK